jgi:hypothetical protein
MLAPPEITWGSFSAKMEAPFETEFLIPRIGQL